MVERSREGSAVRGQLFNDECHPTDAASARNMRMQHVHTACARCMCMQYVHTAWGGEEEARRGGGGEGRRGGGEEGGTKCHPQKNNKI